MNRSNAEGGNPVYHEASLNSITRQHRQAAALHIVDELRLPKEANVLEIGSGAGTLSVALARRNYVVHAIDRVRAPLDLVHHRAIEVGFQKRIITSLGDVQALEFKDRSFDLVLAIGVIPWLQSPRTAMMEIRRVLKPGGYAIVTVDNRWKLNHVLDVRFSPVFSPVRDAVTRMLESLNLKKPAIRGSFPRRHSIREFDALLESVELNKTAGLTLAFGPFTLMGRRILPDSIGKMIHHAFQRMADRNIPGIRSTGSQYMVLAQEPDAAPAQLPTKQIHRPEKRMRTTTHSRGPSQANAVVLSFGGHAEAFDIVRALRMEGIASTVVSCRPHNIAFYSRSCARRVVLPDFEPKNESIILKQLETLGAELGGKPVLFYVSDPELSFVCRFQKALRLHYRFLLPRDEILDPLFNKVLFSKFAVKHRFPVPQTIIVKNSNELDSVVSSIRFPCIVKPAYSQDWVWETEDQMARFGPYKKALRRFTSIEELKSFCKALPDRASGFLIQSYVEGRDEAIASFHGYFDEQSRCLGYFVGRKIRTYPFHTGGGVYVQTIYNQELARQSIGYLQRIGFQGIVKIDYKLGPGDHDFTMLEINSRYNLWELLGAYAGVNLAAIAYRHQMEEDVEPGFSYRNDTRLLFLKQDLRAYLTGYRKTKEWTFISYMKSLVKMKYYRIGDLTDPLPFVVSVIGFTRRNSYRFFASMVARLNPIRSLMRARTGSREEIFSPFQRT